MLSSANSPLEIMVFSAAKLFSLLPTPSFQGGQSYFANCQGRDARRFQRPTHLESYGRVGGGPSGLNNGDNGSQDVEFYFYL